MNQFDKLYNKIISECNNENIINQGWKNWIKNKFGKKSSEERASMCKKLWQKEDYFQLAKQIKKYKKDKEAFNKDPDAKFYYGMLLIKDLINENKLVLHTKNLLLESVATDKKQENEVQTVSLDTIKNIYHKAENFGDKDALYDLAVCYYVGVPKILKKDINKAINYFTQAAKKGCPEALYNLGVIYENGKEYGEEGFPPQDEKKALKYYKYAKKLGYKDAQEPYAYLLKKLYKGQEADANKAEEKEEWDRALDLKLEPPKVEKKIENKRKPETSLNNQDIIHLNNTKNIEKLTDGLDLIEKAAKQGCKEAQSFIQTSMFEQIKKVIKDKLGVDEISSQTGPLYNRNRMRTV